MTSSRHLKEASQFVESLLLGLPVPGVFLAKERDSPRLLIIDGQQRLKTLQFFYDGFFKPEDGEAKKKIFLLTDVQRQFEDRTYKTLSDDDRLRLDNSVIHATIIKQESPKEEEDTSLFYIYGRLNSGGRKLTPQEIRTAVYHGPFADLIEKLNSVEAWREIFGKPNERLKDQELIVRFLALFFDADEYERPMEEFLNKFCESHKKGPEKFLVQCDSLFRRTIEVAHSSLGRRAFRPIRAINAAVFDSTMVGLAKRLERGPISNPDRLREAYVRLNADNAYVETTSKSTSDETAVSDRLEMCIDAFAEIP